MEKIKIIAVCLMHILVLFATLFVAVLSTQTALRMFIAYAEAIGEKVKEIAARRRFFVALTNLYNNLQDAAHNAEAGKWSDN